MYTYEYSTTPPHIEGGKSLKDKAPKVGLLNKFVSLEITTVNRKLNPTNVDTAQTRQLVRDK